MLKGFFHDGASGGARDQNAFIYLEHLSEERCFPNKILHWFVLECAGDEIAKGGTLEGRGGTIRISV